jgi:hypothetical protein
LSLRRQNKRAKHPRNQDNPALFDSIGYDKAKLGFADSEHLRAAARAYALGGWLAVLHGDAFGVFNFLLRTTFHTISLHVQASSRTFTLTIY